MDNEETRDVPHNRTHPQRPAAVGGAQGACLRATSTTLAVTIAYVRDADHATVDGAALTLLLTVLGTLMAVFVADVIAHMVRESTLPSGRELAHLGYVASGHSGSSSCRWGFWGSARLT